VEPSAAIQGLDEIAAHPQQLEGLGLAALAALELKAAAVHAQIAAALAAAIVALAGNGERPSANVNADDHMLLPAEAAQLLRREVRWIYRNAHKLPFVKRVSPRSILCSEAGIRRWLGKRQA
jgi:hypothetical protein